MLSFKAFTENLHVASDHLMAAVGTSSSPKTYHSHMAKYHMQMVKHHKGDRAQQKKHWNKAKEHTSKAQ